MEAPRGPGEAVVSGRPAVRAQEAVPRALRLWTGHQVTFHRAGRAKGSRNLSSHDGGLSRVQQPVCGVRDPGLKGCNFQKTHIQLVASGHLLSPSMCRFPELKVGTRKIQGGWKHEMSYSARNGKSSIKTTLSATAYTEGNLKLPQTQTLSPQRSGVCVLPLDLGRLHSSNFPPKEYSGNAR